MTNNKSIFPRSQLDTAVSPAALINRIVRVALHLAPVEGRRTARVLEALGSVRPLPERADRFAHEFSDGQRRRIAISRIVESGPAEQVLKNPLHAQTRQLIAAARATEGRSLDAISLDTGMA